MIEQPERLVGLASAEIAGEPDENEERTEKEMRTDPDLPEDIEQQRDYRDARDPQHHARGEGTRAALHVEIDGDRPHEGRNQRTDDPEIDVAREVMVEPVECQ